MVFSYPEFFGKSSEDVSEFLEAMEVACISNHIEEPTHVLRLLQICLKGDARLWLKVYQEQLAATDPPGVLMVEVLKQALSEAFKKIEDPDRVWHSIQALVQGDGEQVEDYIKKISLLWDGLCKALEPQQPTPDMMKKDRFMAGLKGDIHWRVELKKPQSCEDAMDIAKGKEWKLQRMSQLGMVASTRKP